MAMKILVVEDEENIQDVCRRYMEREGYDVSVASDGQQGWERFHQCIPDLIIIDIMMPKMDGYELCEKIRRESEVPIIMLTARGEERDRVMGLTLGADDYLTKPFSPRELMLRIRNIFRRVMQGSRKSATKDEPRILEFNTIRIDPMMRRVTINEQPVDLTVKEFDVLHVMSSQPGRVFSKGQLLDLVWGFDKEVDTSAVTVLIRRLREKVEQNASQPKLIHTVWGIGYKFEPNGD
jgi:DNA-binding response OmpR family regulator